MDSGEYIQEIPEELNEEQIENIKQKMIADFKMFLVMKEKVLDQ